MRRKLVRRRKRPEPRAPKPEAQSAPVTVEEPPPAQPVTVAAAPAPSTASPADGVWQLFPQFDPTWSDEEREKWLTSVERITKTLTSRPEMTHTTIGGAS